jgi:hypothetical protein
MPVHFSQPMPQCNFSFSQAMREGASVLMSERVSSPEWRCEQRLSLWSVVLLAEEETAVLVVGV